VVSVWVQNNKIPHPVLLIGWFHFHDGAVLLYFLKKLIDLIAEDKGRTPSDWPLMDSMSAQMDTGIPVADSGVGTELKVLFEPEHVLIILERVIEIAHMKDRTYSLRFHFCQCVCPKKRLKDVSQEFQRRFRGPLLKFFA
jgi:hypothetical protein